MATVMRATLAMLLFWTACAWGQSDLRSAEVRIKAAFLYRFGEFVQWPPAAFAGPDSPFVIGVLGADEGGAGLEQVVADRKIQGRAGTGRRLRHGQATAGRPL